MINFYIRRMTLISSFLIFLIPGTVNAAEDQSPSGVINMKSVPENGNGYFVVEGSPGERKTVTVNLRNMSEQYHASATLFVADAVTAQGGGMGVITPEQATRKQAGGWFANKEVIVQFKPAENQNVNFSFTIPQEVRAGDHIANIVLYKLVMADHPEESPENNKAQVLVNKAYSQSIAVLIKVPGEVHRELVLESIEPLWNGSSLFLNLRISNKGDVIEKSEGIIEIRSDQGEAIYESQGKMDSIYPETSGIYSFLAPESLKKSGNYSIHVNWKYADKTTVNTADKTFSFNIDTKDVKKAKISELATSQKDKSISPNAIILDPKDLMMYAAILGLIILVAILFILWYWRRRKGHSKGKS
ncbi:MAG TPA: hypothetical protein VGE40_10150 [Bacilli bacterium]